MRSTLLHGVLEKRLMFSVVASNIWVFITFNFDSSQSAHFLNRGTKKLITKTNIAHNNT